MGNTKRNIERLVKEINNYQLDEDFLGDEGIIHDKKREHEKLLLQEKIHWHQRAKKQWLKAGDSNTAFLHQYTKAQWNRNNISRLVDDFGWV